MCAPSTAPWSSTTPPRAAQRRVQAIADPQPSRRALEACAGAAAATRLLAYRDGRRWVDVRSDGDQRYLKELAGDEFTAKDFRTWHAPCSRRSPSRCGEPTRRPKTARKRIASEAVKEVAELLGNTPAVCRRAYIDPRVFDRFDSGVTIEAALRDGISTELDELRERDRERIEQAVVELLS